jgi:hypothetical protein
MDAIIRDFLPVDAVFLLQIRVKPGFNVLYNGFPAVAKYICVRGGGLGGEMVNETGATYLSSLLTKSPKPGVSTTVRRRRTPFSSMSKNRLRWSMWRRRNGEGRGLFTGADALDGDGLGPFCVRCGRLLGRIEHGVEEGVDQGRFSQAGFAYERS